MKLSITIDKLKHTIIQMFIFILTFVISRKYFNNVYVFEWTSHRYYLYLWLGVLILTYLDKKYISYAITLANVIGLFIGQYLGDYIQSINIAKITNNTDAENIYRLSKHYGVFIWIFSIMLAILIAIMIGFIKRYKKLKNLSYK
ncbi:hypothetical protein [Peptoniphilus porci]|uniref:Uncharacterized protein n=1 Tax=Peptoniphilus porci TaxID=2652280 RepID=A0A1U7LXK9_9FIRM|nr:hypothetical protein [Peptoniphilus porci]OLR64160.1 hypothetical protein BIV18_00640 [Peptoniphilus porci]